MELVLNTTLITQMIRKVQKLVSSDALADTNNVNDTVRKCKFKLRSLKKLGGVVSEAQRKRLVERVILSRLYQHLDVVSMGRTADLEALQRV